MTTTESRPANPGRHPGLAGRPGRRPRFNSAYLFIAPSVILIAVFIAEPILQTGWMSLHDWTIGEATHKFVGLANYTALYHDSRFWNALRVTVVYTVFVSLGQVLLGLAVASRLRKTTWYSSLLRTAYFFPFIASLIVVGIWKNAGFAMIVLLAGMQQVPAFLYEAATIDGAGAWKRFRHVTLPALRPALLFTTLIATITGLQLFDLVYAMTGGGPIFHTESVVMYLYEKGFVEFQMGYASAISWVLFVIILAISAVQLRVSRYRDVD